MPFYPVAEEPDYEAVNLTSKAAPDHAFASAYKTGLDRAPGSALAATLAGSVVDLADTVASSVVPGVERQELNNKFLGAIGSPGLTGWFDQNRGAVEIGSGLVGIVMSDAIAKRVLAPGSLAMRSIRGVPFAKKIATLDAQYERAVRLATLTTKEMSRRGMMGVERFKGDIISMAGIGSKSFMMTPQRASRAVFRTQAAKGLARNATTEAVMAGLLHTNDFLYSDELSHNIAWGAAGLGIGGAIDSMVSAYTLRKVANSDTVRRLNAKAFDVTGLEGQRIHASSVVDDILEAANGPTVDKGFQFTGQGAVTDKITSLAIAASELQKPRGFTERAQSLFGKRERIATPNMQMAFEEMNKATTRGFSGVQRAGFGTRQEGLGPPIKESLEREPAFLYGIEEIGTTVDNMTRRQVSALRDSKVDKRLRQVQDLLVNDGRWRRTKRKTKDGTVFHDELIPLNREERLALQDEAKALQFKASQVPVTMLEPGEWTPIQLADLADNYNPKAVKTEGGLGVDNVKIWSREREAGDEILGIGSDGQMYIPGNGRLESMKTEDVLNLYQIGNKAVRDFVATQTQFVLPKNPNWFLLDMADQIIRASGDPSLVKYPGSMTRQSAAVESFAQKVSAIRKKEMAVKLANKRGSAESISEAKAFEHKVFFNLPRLTSYQQGLMGTSETPIDLIIAGLKSGDDVRKMSNDELVKLMNDSRKITQFTEETKDTIESLQGNSFNFLMDRDGNPIKPIVAYKRPMAPQDWTRDELFMRQAMKHSQTKEILTGANADPITREIVNAIMANPNAAEARKILELADDQARSFVPGFRESAPQTPGGAFMNAITSRERRDADNLTMRAASIVKEDESRITGAVMKQLINTAMGDTITIVNGARNAGTKLLLNQFHSFRQGWELVREPAIGTMPDGKPAYKFVLDHESLANQERFKRIHNGRGLTKGQVLLSPSGTEVVLDELGFDVLSRMQQLHTAEIAMKNTLLRSQGLPEIKQVPWYAPPANMKGKYVGYTFDLQDNVIPDMTVVANSPEDLAKQANELQRSKTWKPGYTFRQREAIESYMTLWDKAQMDHIAPNTTAIQPEKHNYGRSSGSLLNPNAFDEALVSIRDNMVRHGTDILEVLFDDAIKSARARSKIARIESAVGAKQSQHSSVYDRYVQNLLGRNALNAKDSFIGGFYEWSEQRLNNLLSADATMKMGETYQALKDFLRTSNSKNPVRGDKFNKLAKELGSYMPYKTALEMVERETGSRTPADVAALTAKLSWFEAASRLRWFESMHAVANIGSLMANTPAIIRSLQQLPGETLEQAAKRNSSLVMMQAMPNGETMGLPNVPKLLWTSMKDAWKKVPDEFTKKAIRLGYMDQEVAEFQRQWGSIDSKEGFRGFVFGNESAEGKGVGGKIARSGGLDKWLGLLSDKSEAFSRQWGMYAGRRVAESMGISNVDDQIAFAHDLTNKIIANYNPQNRPEIFQGALGAPLGLFQSYVLNYYQRMFRYMETGNTRALATQFATQSAVFGVGSVPGWDALNWAFFDHQQGEGDDPVDSMYQRFGNADADLIMHGTLSNLPKIFGADGVSLYTRGDAQFRMPVLNLPVADTVKRLMGGLAQGWQQFRDVQGISLNHMAEIASNMLTNRPIAGLIEVAGAHGFDTSWDGQVVSQAQGFSESIYRMLGVRAMQQQKETEQFYANKNAQEEQNVHKTSLRLATRAAIRDGRYDDVPELFQKYVAEGGDPRYYTRWVKGAFDSALDSRGERQLEGALKKIDGSKNAQIGRLLDANIDINEDDLASDDYGRETEIDQLIQQGWEGTPDPTEPDPLMGE